VNKADFNRYLTHPEQLDNAAMVELEALTKAYPYCQWAHIMLAKAAKKLGHMNAEVARNHAVVYSTDRHWLHQYLDDVQTKVIQKTIEKPLPVEPLPTIKEMAEVSEPAVTVSVKETEQKESIEVKTKKGEAQVPPKPNEALLQSIEANLKRLHELKQRAAKGLPIAPLEEENEEETSIQDLPSSGNTVLKKQANLDSILTKLEAKDHTLKSIKEVQDLATLMKMNAVPATISDEKLWPQKKQTIDKHNITILPGKGEVVDSRMEAAESANEADRLLDYLLHYHPKKDAIQERKEAIVSRFIEKDAETLKLNRNALSPSNEVSPLLDSSIKPPISENWALLLASQGQTTKAIAMIEQLKLKNPNKIAYFATLIEKLKNP
jgi:hypothetical protein